MAFVGNLFGDQTGFYVGDTGSITAGAGVSDLVVFTDSNLSLASVITDNGGHLGLTKSGPGILDLSDGNAQSNKPVNSFSGAVTINQGVLLINAAGQLGSSGMVNFNGGELRTYASIITAGTWNVGTQGGVFSYSGGGNSQINNLITGRRRFHLLHSPGRWRYRPDDHAQKYFWHRRRYDGELPGLNQLPL